MSAHREELQSRLDRLIRVAETGEQWADICLIEQQIVDLDKETAASLMTMGPLFNALGRRP